MSATSTPSVSPEDTDDSIESRILDAALVQFEKVGVKKTTIEDVARQAGVDRVTVYRRVGSRDDLVRAVVSREVSVVLAEVARIAERHDDIGDLVADILVTVLTKWRNHPMAQRMLVIEPERVLTKLTTDGATVFTLSVATTAAALERAIARGLLRETPDLLTRAEVICRVVHSLILAPDGGVRLESDPELTEFARTYLLPIIAG
ncbi:TetR/AcrR family transcriptional regulator [Nocardia vinacea]|uniref:TetR/AcrR family transcriptional regulator n=1 Tax=Nocardia vinacea TaxID=96468 RepID=UPI000A30A1A0|nr:TetR/AcrR family transcriptional regulator [Nocardia vinacea]